MSISEGRAPATDFDRWIVAEFAATGAFTAFAVLVGITGVKVEPLCSTYLNVIGDEIDWAEITILFAGAEAFAGADRDGVPHRSRRARVPGRSDHRD